MISGGTLTKSQLWPDLKRTGNIPQLIMTCHSNLGSNVMISGGTLTKSQLWPDLKRTGNIPQLIMTWGSINPVHLMMDACPLSIL